MTPLDKNEVASAIIWRFAWRQLGLAAIIWCATTGYPTASEASRSGNCRISASWQLLGNHSDAYFDAELTLRNEGSSALSGDWALNFNSASKLERTPANSEFDLAHINGDFYVLRPKAGARPIRPTDDRRIALRGSPWAINVSDAPSGFYFVAIDEEQAAEPVAVPLHVAPLPPADKLRRGAADRVPVVTAESRYRENRLLTKIAADQLIKVAPTPNKVTPGSGTFHLTPSTTIFYERPLPSEAKLLTDELSQLLIQQLPIVEGIPERPPAGSIRLRILQAEPASRNANGGGEAYTLKVRPNGIDISGADAAGVFYGCQSLRSLLPVESYRQKNKALSIGSVAIVDAPRFR
jgi:hexosaminidase